MEYRETGFQGRHKRLPYSSPSKYRRVPSSRRSAPARQLDSVISAVDELEGKQPLLLLLRDLDVSLGGWLKNPVASQINTLESVWPNFFNR
jgi:hypothetical protein